MTSNKSCVNQLTMMFDYRDLARHEPLVMPVTAAVWVPFRIRQLAEKHFGTW